MSIFRSIGGSIQKAAKSALNRTVRNVVNNTIGSAVSKMPPIVGAAVGGLLSGQSLGQVVKGVAGGLINNALSQIPGAAGDFFRGVAGSIFGGAGFSASFSGLPASRSQLKKATTKITDPTDQEVEITIDTYLQGLQGGLSTTGNVSSDLFGSAIGTCLAGTALTGAIGAIAGDLSPELKKATDGFAGALNDCVGKLTGDLGESLITVPGIGPSLGNFTNGLDSFSRNIGFAFNGFPATGQQALGTIVLGIGANFIGKKLRKPKVKNTQAREIRNKMNYQEHPAAQLDAIATYSSRLGKKLNTQYDDPAFEILAQKAKKAAKEYNKVILRKADGSFGYKNTISEDVSGTITKIQNGQIVEYTLQDVPNKSTSLATSFYMENDPEFNELVVLTNKDPIYIRSLILSSGLSVKDFAKEVYAGSRRV